MKHYRLNQIAMAVLGALLLFFGARTLIKIANEEPEEEKPGYQVPGTEEAKGGGEQKPGGADLTTLLAAADAAHGAEVAKKCGVCHNFEKGGPNMIGPNLYGVLGRPIASHEGYEYSDALKAKGGNWDYEQIFHMIENPGAYVPGTKMALFGGLPDAKERADVLVFLRTKNDNPPPLPQATAAPAPAAGTPAAEAPSAGGAPTAGAASGQSEVIALLATADAKQGESDAALCKVCHTFDKGGAVVVGPNLYGVLGRKIASQEGFTYTPGLKSHDGEWTFEKLDVWLTNPQAYAPGTMMAFPGLPDAKKRANVIAFLRSKSDSPVPLPAAAPAAAAPPAAPAAPAAAPAEATPPAAPAAAPEAAPVAPAAPEAAPKAEETPAPTPEQTAPAESAAPTAPEAAPAAETPQAAPEQAPAAEQTAPAAPEAAPSVETAPAAEEAPAAQEPSKREPPSPNQPQPVYPDGPPPGVQ
jgi:cytochrome c